VLDDGSQEAGEEFRMRGEILGIGKTAGTIVVPTDISISGSHAEIRRTPWRWHVADHLWTGEKRDLGFGIRGGIVVAPLLPVRRAAVSVRDSVRRRPSAAVKRLHLRKDRVIVACLTVRVPTSYSRSVI